MDKDIKIEFKKANKRQLEAIKHKDGALLIVAGPGTGKTFTLINRALNLIVNEGVEPSKILFATFTEKAARELITRLSSALAENGIEFNPNEMYIGTFHSICLKILKDNIAFADFKKNFSLKDQFDQQYFIYQNYSVFSKIDGFDEFIDPKWSYWNKCEKIMKIVNKLTEEMIDVKKLKSAKDGKYRFYGALLETYELLISEPETAEAPLSFTELIDYAASDLAPDNAWAFYQTVCNMPQFNQDADAFKNGTLTFTLRGQQLEIY